MVPPERRRARDARKGEREDGSPALRAAVRPRGVAAPRPCKRPCAPRPAEPHIPRAHSALPAARRPLRHSAAAARLPQRAVGRAGTGRGARGRARARGPHRRLRHCPGRPRLQKGRSAGPGGGHEGGRWRRGGAGRPAPAGSGLDLSGRTPSGPQPAAPPPPEAHSRRQPLAAVGGGAPLPTAH